jgi:plasmid stabilization system protein ParE
LNIIWSPEALADLEAAVDYLAERSPPAAERLATGIVALALVERLAIEPLEGAEQQALRPRSRESAPSATWSGPRAPLEACTRGSPTAPMNVGPQADDLALDEVR